MSREDTIRFDGRVVLVTGAGRGLGRAYARLFAERGAQVVVHDAGVAQDGSGFDPSVADGVVAEIRAAGGVASAAHENLASAEACRALIGGVETKLGRLDAIIHNAGLVRFATIEETDERVWRAVMAVNVEAPYWLSRAAFPIMRRQGFGRLVMTISGHGVERGGGQELLPYYVSKAALFGLMNALADAGEPDGIRVNAISPVAATRVYRQPVAPGELTPEQAAPGAVFLASEQCDVSGLVLHAGNGRFALGRYSRGPAVDFGPEPATPEAIAGAWASLLAGLPPPTG